MSRSSYSDALAKCPYYMEQGPVWIKCEGITRRGSILVRFRTGKEKAIWVGKRCNSIKGCEECLIWKAKSEE